MASLGIQPGLAGVSRRRHGRKIVLMLPHGDLYTTTMAALLCLPPHVAVRACAAVVPEVAPSGRSSRNFAAGGGGRDVWMARS